MSTIVNVLVLDDDLDICNLFRALLKKMKGVNCVTACDPIEAMYKVENQEFKLVIVDYHLKQKSGIDFIKSLKRINKFNNLKYILISGNLEKKMVVEAIQLGVNDILVKPFGIDELYGKIRTVF